MHERTRRNLCRLAFLALGVVPTLCTLAWASYRTSPLYAEAERRMWETRLSAATGFSTQIGRLEFPVDLQPTQIALPTNPTNDVEVAWHQLSVGRRVADAHRKGERLAAT